MYIYIYIYIYHVIIPTVLFVTASRDAKVTKLQLSLVADAGRACGKPSIGPFSFFSNLFPNDRVENSRVSHASVPGYHQSSLSWLFIVRIRPAGCCRDYQSAELPSISSKLHVHIVRHDFELRYGAYCKPHLQARAYKRAKTGKLAVELPCKSHRTERARR